MFRYTVLISLSILQQIFGEYECNMNVQGLQPIVDHADQNVVRHNGTILDQTLELIQNNFYLQNGKQYNLTIKHYGNTLEKIMMECGYDVYCALHEIQHNDYYSYDSKIIEENYLMFDATNMLPVQVDDVQEMYPVLMNYSDLFNQLVDRYVIMYLDRDVLDMTEKMGGYVENITLVFQKENGYPVMVTGIYNDEYEDIYLEYTPMFGLSWGCGGYGYIRITDYTNDQNLVNNGGILSTMVTVSTSDMYSSGTLYSLKKSDVQNIIIFSSAVMSIITTYITIKIYGLVKSIKKRCADRKNRTESSGHLQESRQELLTEPLMENMHEQPIDVTS